MQIQLAVHPLGDEAPDQYHKVPPQSCNTSPKMSLSEALWMQVNTKTGWPMLDFNEDW